MDHQIDLRTPDSVQAWLAHWMASELNLDAAEIDPDQTFLSYGMDSMHAMMLVGDLEGSMGTRLSPTLAWDYPTVRALAQHVVATLASSTTGEMREPRVSSDGDSSQREPEARAILAQLDGMSEEEMDSLLQQYIKTSR